MYEKLKSAVAAHARKHRLVFWYDDAGTHTDDVGEIDCPAEVIRIENNEFWIKYHVLAERPDAHFLLYAPYPRPADSENWLLDLLLPGFVFSTDLSETYRTELGLPVEFRGFVATHSDFFGNERERFAPLREVIDPKVETEHSIALKMMGILTAASAEERRLPQPFGRVLLALVQEGFGGGTERWDAIGKYGLAGHFRDELGRFIPAPASDIEPHGAAIALFKEVWELEQGGEVTATRRNARVLIHEWRDQYGNTAEYHSIVRAVETALNVRDAVTDVATDQLATQYLFPVIDEEIATRLVGDVLSESADWDRARRIASNRSTSYWVRTEGDTVRGMYRVIIGFVDFRRALETTDLSSLTDNGIAGAIVERYVKDFSRIDRLFRSTLAAWAEAGSPGSLAPVIERLEGRYTHTWLQRLSEVWDARRRAAGWDVLASVPRQRSFFNSAVAPYLQRGDKVVVIISDALRYEAGVELAEALGTINRVSVACDYMAATTPTVTAVGMNALLPHDTLRMVRGGAVQVDGAVISGIPGRSEYLARRVNELFPGRRAGAFRARDIAELSAPAAREQLNGMDLVYLYSNGIDAAADNAKTETELPVAVGAEIRRLTALVKKVVNQLNRTHIVITADHGFLYQHSEPDATQLIAAENPEDGSRERRYIIGGDTPVDHFTTVVDSDHGIDADVPIHFAEGMYRIRKQGSGIRYVHGGVSLQELIVPLIRIRAGRSDDVHDVGVSIMKSASPVITTPDYTVNFFQDEAVSDKRRPVTLRGFFRASDGTVLSDTAEITFDSPDENAQNRGRTATFVFAPGAVAYNNQKIVLVLQKIVGGAPIPYTEETFHYRTFGERDF